MAKESYVRTTNAETGEETVDGPFLTEAAAIAFAKSRIHEYSTSEDRPWVVLSDDGTYRIGHVHPLTARSDVLVTFTVEDREVELTDGRDPS